MAIQQETRTIVGVFENFASAQEAVHEIVASGIPENQIQVQSNFGTGAAASAASRESEAHEGGISGFFHRLFGSDVPEEERGHYSEAVRRGNAVVSVTAAEGEVDRAVEILNRSGVVDIDQHVESYRQRGYQNYDENGEPYTATEAAREREQVRADSQTKTIPVIEEELQIGKRVVRRGGVRVYSQVVDEPVEEQISLREEHVRVERRSVNRDVGPADVARMRDQSIEVTEMAEEPVIAKRARVKEEILVGKEATERTEQVRDTVRRTEVKVDSIPEDSSIQSTQPGYDYASQMANDARYRGKSWSDVEDHLRTDYLRNNPNSKWDQVKGSIREAWEKVTGKR